MIKRYVPIAMRPLWADETKFETWLNVELAVVKAREVLKRIPKGTHALIKDQATFSVHEIEERERETNHDMLAFIEIVRDSLKPELRGMFHDELTSYDVEVPALAIQIQPVVSLILSDLDSLISALRTLASKHAWTFLMGVTHGQDAEPTTFAQRINVWLDMIEISQSALKAAADDLLKVKCSGAVGNYLTIDPKLEEQVIKILDLDTRDAASQIVGRDVFARFVSEIATMGGCIEKMCRDLHAMAMSAYREIEEPRTEKQKGSSAMPHKKNPILLERLIGLSSVLRGYAATMQENIKTLHERDIAHSSVERVVLPDATSLIDYMIQKATWVIENLVVNRSIMANSINRMYGTYASEKVKLLLCSKEHPPKEVYEYVQRCAFDAVLHGVPFRQILQSTPFLIDNTTTVFVWDQQELDACFLFKEILMERLPEAYGRMRLDETLALEPNW